VDEGTILPKIIRFQKYFKKQYDVVFDGLQSYHNLLKEAGITWKKNSLI
jgi:transposase